MFDPSSFDLGGVSLIAFIFGATQFIKEMFNIEGKWATALALFIGAATMGLFQALQFLPAEVIPYVNAVFLSLTMGLSAAGFYKFATKE